MLMVANHLQVRAESAYMERDDVCMTPREISALAGDIKRWAGIIDRLTTSIDVNRMETDNERRREVAKKMREYDVAAKLYKEE